MNNVILMGNLCAPPELRYTTGGSAVCNLRLAVNTRYTTKSGEKRDEVLFVTVCAWGKSGENCAEYLDKGSKILVEGRLQSREWTDRNGQKRITMDVTAKQVTFLTFKDKGTGAPRNGQPQPVAAETRQAGEDEDVPF